MLQGEHSVILLTFIKLPFVIKIFVLSVFEWPLKTGFTVYIKYDVNSEKKINSEEIVDLDVTKSILIEGYI